MLIGKNSERVRFVAEHDDSPTGPRTARCSVSSSRHHTERLGLNALMILDVPNSGKAAADIQPR